MLVGEFDDGFDGDYLASFYWSGWLLYVVSGQAYKMSRETVPLLRASVLLEYGLAGIGDLFVSVSGLEQCDRGLLRFEIDGVPLGLLGRELAADVEGASD